MNFFFGQRVGVYDERVVVYDEKPGVYDEEQGFMRKSGIYVKKLFVELGSLNNNGECFFKFLQTIWGMRPQMYKLC